MKQMNLMLNSEDASCLCLTIADGINLLKEARDESKTDTIKELIALYNRLDEFSENVTEKTGFQLNEKEVKFLNICLGGSIEFYRKSISPNGAADFSRGMASFYENVLERLS